MSQPAVVGTKVRDLTPADHAALKTTKKGALQTQVNTVAKMRETHHQLAKLVAEGRRNEDISRIMGYSPSYISSIKSDPTFAELVNHYKTIDDANFRETQQTLHERLQATAMVAAEEMLERVTTQPQAFTNNELLDTIKTAADRTGYGPQSRTTNVNVNVDMAAKLERARQRVKPGTESIREQRSPPMIDLRATEKSE